MSDPIPTELIDHRYRLEAVLGRGGMGVVYRALDTRLDRQIAVKVLRETEGSDESRFASEVRTLARFIHPRLVRLLDAGEFDGRPYLVMDLIDGPTLAERLRSGPLSEIETARIGAAVASALAYVHEAGIIHRDVKPANVLIDTSGNAHLSDFGIARLVDTTGLTATGLLLGTPAYLAPEQIQGTEIGPAVDIYALGLVLLECLSGRRSFEGTPSEVTAARLGRDPAMPSNLDLRWQHLLLSMTNRDPEDRIHSSDAATQLSLLGAEIDAAGATREISEGETTAVLTGFDRNDTERFAVGTPTLVRSQIALLDPDDVRGQSRPTLRGRAIGIGIFFVAIALGLVLGFGGVFSHTPTTKKPSVIDPRPAATLPPSSTTTTSTTTSTTTTTTLPVPTVSSAASSIQLALQSGVTNGDIAPPAAQALDDQLEHLDFAGSAAQPQQEVSQFDQLVQTFDQDVSNGMVAGDSTVAALTTAIGNLATALGTTVPSTTIATTPGSQGQSGGSGFGHGYGHGH